MMDIQIKRGLYAKLPTLLEGEPAFTTDTEKLYIGTGSENILVSDQTYTHIQSVPEMVWTVTLPEGFKEHPGVVITDSAGTQVFGEVNYGYPVVTLSFAAPFGGQAHFN